MTLVTRMAALQDEQRRAIQRHPRERKLLFTTEHRTRQRLPWLLRGSWLLEREEHRTQQRLPWLLRGSWLLEREEHRTQQRLPWCRGGCAARGWQRPSVFGWKLQCQPIRKRPPERNAIGHTHARASSRAKCVTLNRTGELQMFGRQKTGTGPAAGLVGIAGWRW
jgi:hypothetical protein